MLEQSLIELIQSRADLDQEICGVVIEGELHFSENVAGTPYLNASYDSETIDLILQAQKASRKVILFHTHTKHSMLDDFSVRDIQTSRTWRLPSFLLHVPTRLTRYYNPLEFKPLLNRGWH